MVGGFGLWKLMFLERTIGHRSLRYQNYEQQWRKDASNFQCNGVRIRQAFNTFGVVVRQTLHTDLMTSLHQTLDDQWIFVWILRWFLGRFVAQQRLCPFGDNRLPFTTMRFWQCSIFDECCYNSFLVAGTEDTGLQQPVWCMNSTTTTTAMRSFLWSSNAALQHCSEGEFSVLWRATTFVWQSMHYSFSSYHFWFLSVAVKTLLVHCELLRFGKYNFSGRNRWSVRLSSFESNWFKPFAVLAV